MHKNDQQFGTPEALYKGTKAAIEALTGVPEGAVAYATDTNEFGSYNGSAWTWGQGVSLLADLLDVDLTDLENGVILRYDTDDAKWFAVDGSLIFATSDEGVPNGSSHDHSGGDGAQIAHGNLSGLGSSSGHVTNGDSHDHNGGDGGTIAHANLGSVGADDHHARSHNHSNASDGNALVPDTIQVGTEGTISGFLTLGSSTLTIASGVVTATKSRHSIDTESAAASDDLDTISGFANGRILVLQPASGARTVVVKNGTGNITLAGSDFSMDNANDRIILIGTASGWVELSRANNGA